MSDGAPLVGERVLVRVSTDTTCRDAVPTDVQGIPDPITDATGRYVTEVQVFAHSTFQSCLEVTVRGVTETRKPVRFVDRADGAPPSVGV